jgi:hypothetical protein
MNNLDKWRNYMRDVNSPDNFIDMGFYYMITATLQRKVWVNPEHTALFPNLYVVLVGPAAVGKGRVIKPVTKFLKYWNKADLKAEDIREKFKQKESVDEELLETMAELEQQQGRNTSPPKKLVPIAADATTYEALLKSSVENVSEETIPEIDGQPHPFAPSGKYLHKSLAFCLEEMSSLVKHNAQDVMNYMLAAFDCGDYKYETKHNGRNKLRKTCLNFLAGTTPTFMQKSLSKDILDDGFASRTLFVYEFAARKNQFGIFHLDEEQQADRADILCHLHGISKLFGRVEYTEEAFEYLRWYFEEELPRKRVNNSIRLDSYYGRKDIHAQKLAMAVHFADSESMVIELESVKKAIQLLDRLENNMHYALSFGENPIAPVAKNLLRYLKQNGPAEWSNIWTEFTDQLREDELREAIRYAESTKMVVRKGSYYIFNPDNL